MPDARQAVMKIKNITLQTFLHLKDVWEKLNYILIDFKIEFGFTPSGQLVIDDVIENDSWRLGNEKWKELNKQIFRDGEKLDEVERKYRIVTELAKQFSA